MLRKALLGFSVPDNQPSMTAHYNPNPNPNHLLKTLGDEDVRLIYEIRCHLEQSECLSCNPALKHKWQPTQELEVEWLDVEGFASPHRLIGPQV